MRPVGLVIMVDLLRVKASLDQLATEGVAT
jgi:hypothetical protein